MKSIEKRQWSGVGSLRVGRRRLAVTGEGEKKTESSVKDFLVGPNTGPTLHLLVCS